MSLPIEEKYENLKDNRKQENSKQESEKNHHAANTNKELSPAPAAPRVTSFHTQSELKDPLGQKIENIQSFLRQPQEAHWMDEVYMLDSNLQQLEDSMDLVYVGNQ